MSSALQICLAAFLAGLLAVERKGFLQAGLARPLLAGAILGAALGEPVEGLAIGAAFELFYLGSVNLGASLPDNELFAAVAATCCACGATFSGVGPPAATMAAATLLALPAAKLGRVADQLSERVNEWAAGRVEGIGPVAKVGFNLAGLWAPFLSAAALALAYMAFGRWALAPALGSGPPDLKRALSVVWTVFLTVSAAAALRAVRARRAGLWAALAAVVAAGAQALRLGSFAVGAAP